MKNKETKPVELQHIPTLKVEISSDQAKQSNQLEAKLVVQVPTGSYSKKDMIKFLEGMANTIKETSTDPNTLQLIQVLNFAVSEVGKCIECLGTGEMSVITKPAKDYKIKKNKLGQTFFLVPCVYCNGSGKQLSVQCASCGKNASIMPEQKHFSYCQECETRLVKSGYLI